MKKISLLTMTLLLGFTMAACGGTGKNVSAEAPKPAGKENQRILIAYFSWGGNTERTAKAIQSLVGGDLFRIVPVKEYPKDYTKCVEVAKEEKAAKARPEIKGPLPDLKNYDVIFVGYPIWISVAPMPVYTFMEACDFTGKTVVPFCTAGGSGIEGSIHDMEKMAAKGKVLKGLKANNPADISPWLKDLGFMK